MIDAFLHFDWAWDPGLRGVLTVAVAVIILCGSVALIVSTNTGNRLGFLIALTGFCAALAGLLYASRVASANPTEGSGLMLNAIAAVFLGMTMAEHGEPRVLATVVGVLILGVLDNGLTQMSVDSYVRQILVGIIIVIAVSASSISKATRR